LKNLLIPAFALALAGPVMAMPADQTTTSVVVKYHDLNLSNSRDAAVALKRIDKAAMRACGASEFSLQAYKSAVRDSTCYRDGMNQAVASLNAPLVQALYLDRGMQVARN
jgi:UrcA family protein